MGSKSSAILCDLSLISVEHQFLIKPIPDTIKTIYTPLTAFRYQDDILVFNYPSSDFMKIYRYIYPNELELEADPNETGKSVNYLDTRICLNDNKIVRSLYDKRDSFNFEINNLFHCSSNIRNNLSYNVTYAQIIRICKINNSYAGLVTGLDRLRLQLLKNGFRDKIFQDSLKKVCKNRFELIHKFMDKCDNNKVFLNKLLLALNSINT